MTKFLKTIFIAVLALTIANGITSSQEKKNCEGGELNCKKVEGGMLYGNDFVMSERRMLGVDF